MFSQYPLRGLYLRLKYRTTGSSAADQSERNCDVFHIAETATLYQLQVPQVKILNFCSHAGWFLYRVQLHAYFLIYLVNSTIFKQGLLNLGRKTKLHHPVETSLFES